jgi:hypothetical protein
VEVFRLLGKLFLSAPIDPIKSSNGP